jgi:hypothetical protein
MVKSVADDFSTHVAVRSRRGAGDGSPDDWLRQRGPAIDGIVLVDNHRIHHDGGADHDRRAHHDSHDHRAHHDRPHDDHDDPGDDHAGHLAA